MLCKDGLTFRGIDDEQFNPPVAQENLAYEDRNR
jgi:hypothetical protein